MFRRSFAWDLLRHLKVVSGPEPSRAAMPRRVVQGLAGVAVGGVVMGAAQFGGLASCGAIADEHGGARAGAVAQSKAIGPRAQAIVAGAEQVSEGCVSNTTVNLTINQLGTGQQATVRSGGVSGGNRVAGGDLKVDLRQLAKRVGAALQGHGSAVAEGQDAPEARVAAKRDDGGPVSGGSGGGTKHTPAVRQPGSEAAPGAEPDRSDGSGAEDPGAADDQQQDPAGGTADLTGGQEPPPPTGGTPPLTPEQLGHIPALHPGQGARQYTPAGSTGTRTGKN